jgi:hypothetical protein
MNRAERRRAEREGVQVKEATKTVDQFIHIYTLSIMLALDSVRLPKQQVLDIMDKIQETADCMLHDYINQKDVEKMCADEYGIEFVEESRKRKIFVKPDGTLLKA